jgi:hypothetical protein
MLLTVVLGFGCGDAGMTDVGAQGMTLPASDAGGAAGAGGAPVSMVDASPAADTGTGGAVGAAGAGGHAGAATGGVAGQAAAGGASGTGGADATGGAGAGGAQGGAGGATTEPLYCAQIQGLAAYTGGCGYLGHDGARVHRWKNGLACTDCEANQKLVTGCKVDVPPYTDAISIATMQPTTFLCVQACGECCFKEPGASCESDADCCSPLHCQAHGAGKTCG